MPKLMPSALLEQLDQLPREGALILEPDGETATWCYDPSYFVRAAERLGVSLRELALRAGWRDEAYVSRKLGLRPYTSGDGKARYLRVMGYDSALRLAQALGLDYVEAGV